MIELDVIDAKQADAEEPKERFWRSPAQLKRSTSPETANAEFGPGASEPPSGASRRQFIQLMGAAMAMGGLTACRRPVERILPYARKPEEVIPGIKMQYATGMPFRGVLRPLLVESHEGRPTKIEGNAEHPSTNGATSPFEQASVLNLYDPDRSRLVLRDGNEATWNDLVRFCRQLGDGAVEKQIAVMVGETSSPTVQAMRDRIQQRYPNLRWVTYSAEGSDPQQIGMQQAFGRPLRPQYRFGEADVIVSLDADFLSGMDRNYLHNAASFAEGRRLEPSDSNSDRPDMSRLYVVESTYSTTGGMADNRLRMKASRIPAFAAALAAELGVGTGASVQLDEKEQTYVQAIAQDLQEAGSRGVVLAGETQDPAVHALSMAINDRLGSIGSTVQLFDTGEETMRPQEEELAELVEAMNGGEIDALFIIGVNPVYNAPADLDFLTALKRVDETVHVDLHINETARNCRWHVPQAHYLEAWGDGRSYDGTLSVIQPLISPLYDAAHSDVEVLNTIATGLDAAGYDLVREQWRTRIPGSFEQTWRRALHEGYLEDTRYPTVTASASAGSIESALPQEGGEGYEVTFRLDPTLLDGRFSNNAWMQELPDPVTKLVWDNVAVMSRATMDELGVSVEYDAGKHYADRVDIEVNGQVVNLPVWEQPGFPDGAIGVTFGYGRALTGTRTIRETPFWDRDSYTDVYGSGPIAGSVDPNDDTPIDAVGQRVEHLRPLGRRTATGARVQKNGEGYMLASTQEHGTMEGRPIVRWATLDEYRENPAFVEEMEEYSPGEPFAEYPTLWEGNHPADAQAYRDNPYYKNQWGMVVDLNTCTGCNACIVACTSENNVQVVGKEEVSRGRHMYWLRMDRYYVTEGTEAGEEGTLDESPALNEPEMVMQPVMCQHCENAPCESVCPVAATVHSPDGTNQMIYNRCIGTRYCSNNCPYKVRRFNFYNWTKTLPTEVQMAHNPKVSVRFRGVMEKCSFCVQRIRNTQSRADNENRELRPNEVKTACQQACPTNAIVFGDLNNAESDVVRLKKSPRRYELLAQLNVKPRLSYLGRVRNPNPRLEQSKGAQPTA